jgi:hypothetical protein
MPKGSDVTNRLPAQELLHVIRISQAERRAEARARRDEAPDLRPFVVHAPEAPLIRGLRRPVHESVARWLPATRA